MRDAATGVAHREKNAIAPMIMTKYFAGTGKSISM